MVGQVPGLSSALTARENVELSLALRGVEGVELHERTIDALAIVGLADLRRPAVARLSAGERERVALARAIAAGPSFLIADEPTARLDSVTTLAIGGLLADLAREHGTTVVCATHDPLVIALAVRSSSSAARRRRYDRPDGDRNGDVPRLGNPLRALRPATRERSRGAPGAGAAHANLMGEVTLTWDEG